MVDANDDQGRNDCLSDQAIGGLVDSPFHAIERSGRLEQVLAVIEIKHGIAPRGILWIVVAGGQPDAEQSRVVKDAAMKLVEPQVARDGSGADHSLGNSGDWRLGVLDFLHPGKGTYRIQQAAFTERQRAVLLRSPEHRSRRSGTRS